MRALLVHNNFAGQRERKAEIQAAASRFAAAGWQVETVMPSDPTELEQLFRSAVADGFGSLVVSGGDGTVNQAIQALARSDTALGVIPTGTGNVWAKEVGTPLDVLSAADALIAGRRARVDLGRANGRYFLTIAGVGFDARVTRVLEPKAKRRLGLAAYVMAGVAEALRLRGEDVTIALDGAQSRSRILMVSVSNSRLYGGVLKIAPDAYLDDGLLDVLVFRGRGLLETARHTGNTVLGRHRGDPEVDSHQVSRIRVEAKNPLPVQLDGDYFCTTPVLIRVVPRALRVILPPGPHPQLKHADAA